MGDHEPCLPERFLFGHALAVVKAQQDVKHQPKIRTNSEKLGYQKRGRQLYGPDYKAKIVAPTAVEMTV